MFYDSGENGTTLQTCDAWCAPDVDVALQLRVGDVHIWRIALEQDEYIVQSLWRTLSTDERDRASGYRAARHSRAFVVRRGALRTILGSYLRTDAALVRLNYGDCGKPALAVDARKTHQPPVHFNMSHSHELAFCAVSLNAVGIDVEWVRPLDAYAVISQQVLCPCEKRVLRSLPPDHQRRVFYCYWTRKEALLKGIGIGLNTPLNHIDVSTNLCAVAGSVDGNARRWGLLDFIPDIGYSGALAVPVPPQRLFYWVWSASCKDGPF